MEYIILDGGKIPFRKLYRKIRAPRLEIENGRLSLILPLKFTGESNLLALHKRWIIKQTRRFNEIKNLSETISLREDLGTEDFKKRAREKIEYFADQMNVEITDVCFKTLKSRWGSCSTDGKITANLLLRFLPDILIDYILFHEVVHRIERKHNRKFYDIIESRFGDKKPIEKNLSAYFYLLSQCGMDTK